MSRNPPNKAGQLRQFSQKSLVVVATLICGEFTLDGIRRSDGTRCLHDLFKSQGRSGNLTWPAPAASEVPRGKLSRETFVFGTLEIARNHVAHKLFLIQYPEGSPVGLKDNA